MQQSDWSDCSPPYVIRPHLAFEEETLILMKSVVSGHTNITEKCFKNFLLIYYKLGR